MVESDATIQPLYLRNLFIYLLWLLWFVSSPYIWLSGVALAFIGGAHIGTVSSLPGDVRKMCAYIYSFFWVCPSLFLPLPIIIRGVGGYITHSFSDIRPNHYNLISAWRWGLQCGGDLTLAGFKTLNLKKLPGDNLSWQWRAISSKANWTFFNLH